MKRYTSGLGLGALILVIGTSISLAADTAAPVPVATGTLSVSSPTQRAQWQQHMTLGPGDVLNVSLFDAPDTARTELPIGPDGRITFLQARDMMASGLTIDELRTKLDETLAKFYQNPKTIVIPVAYHSKKYVVLGAVAAAGAYPFERPVTLIEAIARAGGLRTGMYEQRSVDLADLQHSFVVRNSQRLTVDFERLFQHGDLTQNILLEPNDYLYFASASANEIYVLGEVTSPGVVAYTPNPTVIKAITARGGFTTHAWKGRVLVVRGSLNHPQTFVLNTHPILSGEQPDFKLQSKDIVYIGSSPWVKAQDILDTAARAFLTGMFTEWSTLHVGPLITSPLLR